MLWPTYEAGSATSILRFVSPTLRRSRSNPTTRYLLIGPIGVSLVRPARAAHVQPRTLLQVREELGSSPGVNQVLATLPLPHSRGPAANEAAGSS